MSMRLSLENDRDVLAAIRRYGRRAVEGIAQDVEATAIEVRGDIVSRIQRGPASGVTYYRIPGETYMTIRAGGATGAYVASFRASGAQNLSRTHQASAPGEAPATDTGGLASSISYRMTGDLAAEVESRLPQAKWLEEGTAKIEPRPSWVPAIESKGPRLRTRVIRTLENLQ